VTRPLTAFIDSTAFASNKQYLQARAPQSEHVLVVKANAYGHGVEHLLPELHGNRVAVASAEEALQLFDLGFDGEIVLLEGPFQTSCVQSLLGKPVSYAIHRFDQLQMLLSAGYQGRVWLKVDTGMHRLGLNEQELDACLALIEATPGIELEVLMTHFASADDRRNASFLAQNSYFKNLIAERNLANVSLSLCNSAALLLHPEAQEQIVRPGIALYGGSPAPFIPESKSGLQPVMSLESEVIALREVNSGEAVGYGGTWAAKRRSIIATIAVGYGDGYPRLAPEGTPVFINGVRAPIVGRVSMDMITVDVTDVGDVAIGSKVELWGRNLSIDDVASVIGTISYELTASLTVRVPRVRI